MHLQKLQLTQFKNYEQASFEFINGINCLLGINGIGKTNLLDAIHYLSFTKSAFNAVDKDNVKHDATFFSLKSSFLVDNKSVELLCAVQQGEKKLVKWGGKPYEKLSEHIGRLPLVMIAPQDNELIKDSSEVRRRFFDSLLCQIDKEYLSALMRYNHLLKQRNALLKQLQETNSFDKARLEPFDELMVPLALKIAKKRKNLNMLLQDDFIRFYEEISDNSERVTVLYSTEVQEDFSNQLISNYKRDFFQGRTNVGVHKDDYKFYIDGHSLKKFGSQGQQKSFLIALKLSQFITIEKATGKKPILLLDDIFDKLDDIRIAYLLKMTTNGQFGQIFLTDARPERTKKYLEHLSVEKQYFELEKVK